ncbi:hypothetical protein [Streptomyces sp. NPDC093589]|uniref:hypothetical protein n=1 Tax=Streptomyces sp. NPDC093589 TaxID=3366043 RepID=UPI003806FD11
MSATVAEPMINALRAAGYDSAHKFTDVGYSAVTIELGAGSVLRIFDKNCSAHHTVDGRASSWWAVALTDPDPEDPEFFQTFECVYSGTDGTPFDEDTAACVCAVDEFLSAR